MAKRLSVKYGKLWVAAEVFLFVLVGATVNIGYLGKVGAKALLLIVGALVFRMLGVFVCLLGTSLSKKERLFAMMAYTPKATVQAAIGGIPLALGFACGDTVLTVAVLAIVLTELFWGYRVWCRSLCPLGGFYEALGRFGQVNVKIDPAACIHCDLSLIHI